MRTSLTNIVRRFRKWTPRSTRIARWHLLAPALAGTAAFNIVLPNAHDVSEMSPHNSFGSGLVDDTETAQTYEDKFEREFHRSDLDHMGDITSTLCWDAHCATAEEPCVVVDIGAGTGLYMEPLSKALPENGALLDLDIIPSFVSMLQQKAAAFDNVIVGQNEPDSLCLPESLLGRVSSFVLVFAYHHLDNRKAILNDIYRFLKPGGRIVVIEFDGQNGHGHDEANGEHVHGHGHGHEHGHTHGSNESHKEKALCSFHAHNSEGCKNVCASEEGFEEFVAEHIHFCKDDCVVDFAKHGFAFRGEIAEGRMDLVYALVFEKVSFD